MTSSRPRAALAAAGIAALLSTGACFQFDDAFTDCKTSGRCFEPGAPASDEDAGSGDAGSGGTDGGLDDSGTADGSTQLTDAGAPEPGFSENCLPLATATPLVACTENPFPTADEVKDLWVSPGGTVWAAGGGGMILGGLPDGGWRRYQTDYNDEGTASFTAPLEFSSIAGVADDDFWIAGWENGAAVHFTDGGFAARSPSDHYWYSLACAADGTCWFGNTTDYLYAFDPIAAKFSFDNPSTTNYGNVNALWVNPAGDVWASGGASIFAKDGGTWTKIQDPSVNGQSIIDLYGTSWNDMFATTNLLNGITHFNGSSWAVEPMSAYYVSVHGNGTQVRAVGLGGMVGRRNGSTWNEVNVAADDLSTVFVTPDGGTWIGGHNGRLMFDPGNGSFSDRSTGVRVNLERVSATDVNNVWAVGGPENFNEKTAVLRRVGPTEWKEETPSAPLNTQWHGVFTFGPNDTWAVGSAGAIAHWTGNETWTNRTNTMLSNKTLRAVWGAAPDDVWIVGDAATILHWNGKNLTRVQVPGLDPSSQHLTNVQGSGKDNVWATGRNGAIVHGPPWTVVSPPSPGAWTSGVSVLENDVWISCSDGIFHRDLAAGWKQVPTTLANNWDVLALEDGTVWATGTDGQLLELNTVASGKGFVRHPSGSGRELIALTRSGNGGFFAVGNAGIVVDVHK